MFGNEQVVIFTPTNVQLENVSFFFKVPDEEKFKHGQIKGKAVMLSYWFA